ncbi:hypothetical protein F7725_006093 [Dissostichus mawsoni]|uniref:Large ribosomal subunit protein mL45 n=1 Tax=Dissostichus mawsoni TaxID=36200 RepID=A0A7J5YX90_DISMA|nr:hypothetical protein F7725_006093 [Dissostichus mawsoni]
MSIELALINRKSSFVSDGVKMATPMRRTLVALHRATCSSLMNAEASLDLRHPLPLYLPVRTKKRYFIPPAVGMKGMKDANIEDRARKAGVAPRQQYFERPINMPPLGDARLSSLSKEGLKQRTEQIKQSAGSQLAIRKIKEHDPQFSTKSFAEQAQEIFIEAHTALTQFNKEKLHSLLTERCYPPPKVVHARCPDMISKGNLYGQVTVRMHSKQTLAIYDRFGRLMMGSEEQPKDVLEYLVIERHLMNPYGRWRLHGKITVLIPGPDLKPGEEFEALNHQVPKPEAVQWSK